MWNLFTTPPEDDDTSQDKVLWEEESPPFVLPFPWSAQWERQQRKFLEMSRKMYQRNMETQRTIMFACLENMKVPFSG